MYIEYRSVASQLTEFTNKYYFQGFDEPFEKHTTKDDHLPIFMQDTCIFAS